MNKLTDDIICSMLVESKYFSGAPRTTRNWSNLSSALRRENVSIQLDLLIIDAIDRFSVDTISLDYETNFN